MGFTGLKGSCRRVGVLVIAGAVASLGLFAGTASAGPPSQGWTSIQAPLPGDAATNPNTLFFGVSCPAAQACIGVGDYNDSGAHTKAAIETQSGTSWADQIAPLPSNAGTGSHLYSTFGVTNCTFFGDCEPVSCPASGVCVGVGVYDTSSGSYGLIETLANGAWTPLAAPEPSDQSTPSNAQLASVQCTTPTACVAVGSYENTVGHNVALIDVLSGSTWTAFTATIPANGALPASAGSNLLTLSCASPTSCVAVGRYLDTSAKWNGLIEVMSGTTWSAVQAPLPANSGTDGDTHLNVSLLSASCAAPTGCVVVGSYVDSSGNTRGVFDMLSGTTWSATEAPRPANASALTSGSPTPFGVSCPTVSWCVASGGYNGPGGQTIGLIETWSHGAWSAAATPLPADATTTVGQGSYLSHPTCPTVSYCAIAANYIAGVSSTTTAMIVTWSARTWSAAASPLPATGLVNSYLLNVSCASPVACAAVGNDSDGTHSESMLDTLVGPQGYWLSGSDGGIFTFGNLGYFGSTGAIHLNKPIVGMAATPDGQGYWFVGSDGGVFTYGDAKYWGSTGALTLNKPIVGMAATPDGLGYWLVASDGGIFAFGSAKFWGSTGNIVLNKPIVGMAATPDGLGYWLVASDGGIFTEGDATFMGSTGNIVLNKPIVGMAATPNGDGYWLVASDGGIFTEGNAPFYGSTGAIHLNKPIVGMASTPSGKGYWLVASDGGMFSFGDATFYGSTGAIVLNKPIVGMAT